MRLWSLDPRLLDARGLVALWREGLLARAVLRGATRGYRAHPQLDRFRARRDPVAAIDCYLSRVLDEARRRGYAFDGSRILYRRRCRHRGAAVTAGQLRFEWEHLLGKLAARAPARWRAQRGLGPAPHGCFCVVEGPRAPWERGGHASPPRTGGRRRARGRSSRPR
jgi:hypothetical protein